MHSRLSFSWDAVRWFGGVKKGERGLIDATSASPLFFFCALFHSALQLTERLEEANR